MKSNEYELLKDHIDVKFNTLGNQLKFKLKEDKVRDKRIDKIEKRIFIFAVVMVTLLGGPEAISYLIKGMP